MLYALECHTGLLRMYSDTVFAPHYPLQYVYSTQASSRLGHLTRDRRAQQYIVDLVKAFLSSVEAMLILPVMRVLVGPYILTVGSQESRQLHRGARMHPVSRI